MGLTLWLCNNWVKKSSEKCYSEVKEIPANNVGLLLGTSKYARGGENLFFLYRINAALELFKAGKIKHILVSGDNHVLEYNEAEDMQKALISAGVPDSCITLDYAGFRTLDSVVRCEKVFGQKKFTIISQPFHNERALFIAKGFELDCVGFNAKDVPANYSIKTKVREYFARVKCVLDIYILKTEPKFLGEQVHIAV
ncbi:MAG TPA: ElyC/SanA/YdcF family protein [Bacteroidia bacterium]